MVFHQDTIGVKYSVLDLSSLLPGFVIIGTTCFVVFSKRSTHAFINIILLSFVLIFLFTIKQFQTESLTGIYFIYFALITSQTTLFNKRIHSNFTYLLLTSCIILLPASALYTERYSSESFIITNSGFLLNNNLFGSIVGLLIILFNKDIYKSKLLQTSILVCIIISQNATSLILFLLFNPVLRRIVKYIIPFSLLLIPTLLFLSFARLQLIFEKKLESFMIKFGVFIENIKQISDLNILEFLLGTNIAPKKSESSLIDFLYSYGLVGCSIFLVILLIVFSLNKFTIKQYFAMILLLLIQNSVLSPLGGILFGVSLSENEK